jgi:hypothetical protein
MIEQAPGNVWDLHQSIEFYEDDMAYAREYIAGLLRTA